MSSHRPQDERASESRHEVQLFDEPESLAETVGGYLFDGWQQGETLLIVVRPDNWSRVSRVLELRGCPVDAVVASGRLVVFDAPTTLASIVRNGQPALDGFHETVVRPIDRLWSQFRKRLRIYGEMVDILASQDDFNGALALERLWNVLAASYPFTLLCGYSSGHFGDPRTASVLADICGAHSVARAKPSDLLASWLLGGRQSRFYVDPVIP
jgi:hypothetical protein